MLIGFLAMLHSSEMAILIRRDLVFPSDAMGLMQALYVHLRKPKTTRFARRQHEKIDDTIAIRILEALFGGLGPDECLFLVSPRIFRRLWDALSGHPLPCCSKSFYSRSAAWFWSYIFLPEDGESSIFGLARKVGQIQNFGVLLARSSGSNAFG